MSTADHAEIRTPAAMPRARIRDRAEAERPAGRRVIQRNGEAVDLAAARAAFENRTRTLIAHRFEIPPGAELADDGDMLTITAPGGVRVAIERRAMPAPSWERMATAIAHETVGGLALTRLYVVASYGTPIAWALGDGPLLIPSTRYSATTSQHQHKAAESAGARWLVIPGAEVAEAVPRRR